MALCSSDESQSNKLLAGKRAQAEHLLDNMTWPERILWSRLRQKGIGYSFQRQAVVCGFIVDFWCNKARVAVELDGPVHHLPENIERDRQKDSALALNRIDLLRFPNSDVYKGMSAVLLRIWEHCYARAPLPLSLLLRATTRHRYEETVEMRALLDAIEAKRLEEHASNFSNRYWKGRPIRRGWRRG